MSREDVMRLADKIGWHQNKDFKDFEDLWIASADLVARFYDAAYAAGAAAEREACARLVDYWEARQGEHADAIRARGQA